MADVEEDAWWNNNEYFHDGDDEADIAQNIIPAPHAPELQHPRDCPAQLIRRQMADAQRRVEEHRRQQELGGEDNDRIRLQTLQEIGESHQIIGDQIDAMYTENPLTRLLDPNAETRLDRVINILRAISGEMNFTGQQRLGLLAHAGVGATHRMMRRETWYTIIIDWGFEHGRRLAAEWVLNRGGLRAVFREYFGTGTGQAGLVLAGALTSASLIYNSRRNLFNF